MGGARHAGGSVPIRLRLQRAAAQGRAGQSGLGRGAEPVPAPRRSGAEPRQHGEGLCAAGEASADTSHRGARARGVNPGDTRARRQPGSLRQVPGRAARARRRALAPAGGRRVLSAAQVGREFPRPAGAARRYREPHRGGAQPLHQGGAGVQRDGTLVSEQPDRHDVRLQAQAEFHGGKRAGDREAAARRFRHQGQVIRLFLAAWFFAAAAWAQQSVPPLTAQVVDQTGTLTTEQNAALERKLRKFELRKGAQIAVLMVPSTAPEPIEQYSLRVAEQWKLGRKKVDDGALLIVAKNDRALRIEVGYGLEGALNDATAKRIVSDIIAPRFRDGDFYGGVNAGVDAMMGVIEGEPLPAPKKAAPSEGGNVGQALPILLILALVAGGLLRAMLGRFLGGAITGGLVGALAWLLVGTMAVALFAGVIAFLFTLLGGGRSYGYYGGFPGGFGGGGFSSGGGFSGGGGSFGGGGASGRW